MEAALATLSVGRERLRTLMHDHGRETITSAMGFAIAYSERVFRSALQRIPDGRYTGEAVLDHDGLGREDLAVRVALERTRDGVILDFAGTAEQSAGFVNSPPANTRAFALLPFLGFVDESISRNAGFLRALEVRLPGRSLVNPDYPAPTGWCHDHVGYEISAAVGEALASALPEEAGLGHACRPLAYAIEKRQRFGGVEEQLGRTDYAHLSQPGASATAHADGWGPPGAAARALLPSVEEWESSAGAMIERFEYLTDSGGAGRFRGSPATETVIKLGGEGYERLYACLAGSRHAPPGRLEGLSAKPAALRVAIDGELLDVQTVEIDRPLTEGCKLTIVAAAGGGWGDPRERDPEAVRTDVLDGYVSSGAAGSVYGVSVDGSVPPRPADAVVPNEKSRGGD